MKFVEKKHHAEAHKLEDGFLQRNKAFHGGKYADDLYDYLAADFCAKNLKTKKALADILEKEQDGRCCYCMRNMRYLPAEEKSIEHAIVNHPVDKNEYNQYLGKESSLDTAQIEMASEFIDKQVPPPPYPHSTAYENMLLSCMGRVHIGIRTSFTCNGKRGHSYVPPFPLMPRVQDEIKYRKDGTVYWVNETNIDAPSVNTLGLNESVLLIIRRIWYKLAICHITPATCNRERILYEVLGEMLDENCDDAIIQLLFVFNNNSWYWGLLNDYDYFNDIAKFE